MQIPTYIINLKSRPERKASVLKEFAGKSEFDITIVGAIEHQVGLIGLWQTMKHILRNLIKEEDDLILVCQDDHQFTEHYSYEVLKESIEEAISLNADIILGGVSWFQTAFQSTPHLFWTEKFSGLQFAIIFRRFFEPLLQCELDGFDAGDYRISAFTDKKWIIYPYISIQKDYGYSDVTLKKNKPERQQQLFSQSDQCMKTLLYIAAYFKKMSAFCFCSSVDTETVVIPTFVILQEYLEGGRAHIKEQFEGRKEFEVSLIDTAPKSSGITNSWKTIKKIVATAIENDEDIIVLCKDTHCFASYYCKEEFIFAILEAHQSGADLLLGGISGGVSHIFPISHHLYWIDSFYNASFIVIYKKLFPIIINEPYDAANANEILSVIATNKIIFYPFFSTQMKPEHANKNDYFNQHADAGLRFLQHRFARVERNFRKYYKGRSYVL